MEVDQRKKMEKKRRNERSENNWGKGERDISERREGKREGRWKEGRERKSKSGGGERERQTENEKEKKKRKRRTREKRKEEIKKKIQARKGMAGCMCLFLTFCNLHGICIS